MLGICCATFILAVVSIFPVDSTFAVDSSFKNGFLSILDLSVSPASDLIADLFSFPFESGTRSVLLVVLVMG